MAGGGIGGALVGIAGGAISSAIDFAFANSQAKKAYKRQRALIRDKWSLNVEGMREAGINPILAAGSGLLGTGGIPSVGLARAPSTDLSASAAKGVQAQRGKAEIEALQAQATSSYARAAADQNTANLTMQRTPAAVREATSAAALRKAEAKRIELENVGRGADAELYRTEGGKKLRQMKRIFEAFPIPFVPKGRR